jgi:hypothetical protein
MLKPPASTTSEATLPPLPLVSAFKQITTTPPPTRQGCDHHPPTAPAPLAPVIGPADHSLRPTTVPPTARFPGTSIRDDRGSRR